jgi:uncharacterized YigZ family protein
MAGTDTYLTIKAFSRGLYKEKGSIFIALAHPVRSASDIKTILKETRKEYHSARHHCYAYMLGQKRDTWRTNDDGEPSGTAGKPILGQINSHGLTNVLIVVVRYFGGRLLGTGGLINAYRSAADDALKNGEITEMKVHDFFRLEFGYPVMKDVMKIIKEHDLLTTDQNFGEKCRITVSLSSSASERIHSLFSRIEGLKSTFLYSD